MTVRMDCTRKKTALSSKRSVRTLRQVVFFQNASTNSSITASAYSPYRMWVSCTLYGNDSSGCLSA